MLKSGFRLALEFGDDALGQGLAQLNAPLVERINVPDDALRENGVLVERDELAEHFRREPFGKNHVRWAIALEHSMRRQPIRRALSLDLLAGLPERQRL